MGKHQCLLDIPNHSVYDGAHFDRYLPFSELSMFTYKTKEANFALSLSILVLSVCIYLYAICCRKSKKKWSNSPQRNPVMGAERGGEVGPLLGPDVGPEDGDDIGPLCEGVKS